MSSRDDAPVKTMDDPDDDTVGLLRTTDDLRADEAANASRGDERGESLRRVGEVREFRDTAWRNAYVLFATFTLAVLVVAFASTDVDEFVEKTDPLLMRVRAHSHEQWIRLLHELVHIRARERDDEDGERERREQDVRVSPRRVSELPNLTDAAKRFPALVSPRRVRSLVRAEVVRRPQKTDGVVVGVVHRLHGRVVSRRHGSRETRGAVCLPTLLRPSSPPGVGFRYIS